MNLISSKIAKHVDVLKLFISLAVRTVGLQQLLHYDAGLTTHFCERLPQILAVWLASDHLHFARLSSYLVRNKSV